MFYLPFMDVYFNLSISKIIYKKNRLLFVYIYVKWIIFEIGRLKYLVIHVEKVKHKNNCNQTET